MRCTAWTMETETVGACVLVTTYDEYNGLLLYLSAYLCLSVRTFCFAKTTQIVKKTRPKPLGHERCPTLPDRTDLHLAISLLLVCLTNMGRQRQDTWVC